MLVRIIASYTLKCSTILFIEQTWSVTASCLNIENLLYCNDVYFPVGVFSEPENISICYLNETYILIEWSKPVDIQSSVNYTVCTNVTHECKNTSKPSLYLYWNTTEPFDVTLMVVNDTCTGKHVTKHYRRPPKDPEPNTSISSSVLEDLGPPTSHSVQEDLGSTTSHNIHEPVYDELGKLYN